MSTDPLWTLVSIIGGCALIRIAWKQLRAAGKRDAYVPPCYGEYPRTLPHVAAERDCHRCRFEPGCVADTPRPATRPGREAPTPWAAPMPEIDMKGPD